MLWVLDTAAGAAGIARLNDLLCGHPDALAILVSLELCSLTIQWHDTSMANIVGTGLFGDGASALVLAGEYRLEKPIARVLGSRSALYPESTETIGWNIGSHGLRLMLTPAVPKLIDRHLADDIDDASVQPQVQLIGNFIMNREEYAYSADQSDSAYDFNADGSEY